MPANTIITIGDIELKLSNLDKVFYSNGFTKGEVIDYYIRIAPVLLPHIKDRPMTLKRYPHGADDKFFYQKECPANRPGWFNTVPVWSDGRGTHINFCLIDSLPSLIWATNMAVLELHPSLSFSSNTACPSLMVFDLDPGPPANMVECSEVALMLRSILETYGLRSFPKTSGSKGLQVYVPLNVSSSYEQTKTFSHFLAKALEKHRPDLIVAKMKKDLRAGKVFIDWSQNDEHKTTVSVYSLRAKDHPSVSTPVTWTEVQAVYNEQKPDLLDFDSRQVLERVKLHGDLFAQVLSVKQHVPVIEQQKKAANKAARRRTKQSASLDAAPAPEQMTALPSDY